MRRFLRAHVVTRRVIIINSCALISSATFPLFSPLFSLFFEEGLSNKFFSFWMPVCCLEREREREREREVSKRVKHISKSVPREERSPFPISFCCCCCCCIFFVNIQTHKRKKQRERERERETNERTRYKKKSSKK